MPFTHHHIFNSPNTKAVTALQVRGEGKRARIKAIYDALWKIMHYCEPDADKSADLDQVAAEKLAAFYEAFPIETGGHRLHPQKLGPQDG